ncbi:zinc ribbon domain-containing protein [Nocardioides halotolerans]|uniref:zinc ribbon domain-containing protein n=1 Tax=Nocardioides halotolerans TaxID=433660 RepID=UPI00040C1480|nr:zinc ribbon domain-containing protein [Nocardioides halotolerans]
MTTTPENPATGGIPVAPPGARFDPMTGAELSAGVGAGGERRQSYALQPGEPVASFNLVTSLMPLASGNAPQTYRWALGLGVLIPVVAGALGFLAFAFVAAAVVVPAIYVVYMYDVNQWEDQPIGVVLGAIGAAAALGVGFTFLWHAGILDSNISSVNFDGNGAGGVRWTSLLVLVLLVPIVGEVLKQVGPLVLAGRPQFDDMIDGLTFGVAAGAAFAAAETIVVNRGLFSSFGQIDSPDAGFWVSLILSAAVVKPIVYGAATGIAVASYSGLGAGYDGFKPGYFRGLAEALIANVAFQAGLFFASRLEGTKGAVVGLVWGAIVAAALVVRLRYLLHFAVLEAALEAAATGGALKDTARGTAYCPSCEMPLLVGANFCVACGTSVRAGSKVTRVRNRVDDTVEGVTPARPALKPVPVGVAPQDNKRTALVVGAVAATIVVAGVVGQAAASAAAADDKPPVPIQIETQVGSGPTTEPAPTPVPAPGPSPDASEAPSTGTAPSLTQGFGSVSSADLTSPADPSDSPDGGGLGGGIDTGSSDSHVVVGGDIGFDLPAGYEIEQQADGFVQVFGDGGYFFAIINPAPTDANAMITENLNGIQSMGVQDLAVSDPQEMQIPTSAVVQAVALGYQGALASQQGGTIPVEGFAYYFLLQDGTGVTAFVLYQQGALDVDSSPLIDGYNAMFNSLVSSF